MRLVFFLREVLRPVVTYKVLSFMIISNYGARMAYAQRHPGQKMDGDEPIWGCDVSFG